MNELQDAQNGPTGRGSATRREATLFDMARAELDAERARFREEMARQFARLDQRNAAVEAREAKLSEREGALSEGRRRFIEERNLWSVWLLIGFLFEAAALVWAVLPAFRAH